MATTKSQKADPYQPSREILRKYAQVLVNFALNSGEGVKPGEVVQCLVPDVAKPLALELQNTLLRAGAHPMIRMLPTGFDRDFYELANEDQLTFFPKEYMKARVKVLDHSIGIIADVDPEELKNVDPAKIFSSRDAKREYRDWLNDKENRGQFTWTLGLWGVEAKAKIVGLSLKEYWQQIISACFLDEADPVAHWKEVFALQEEIKKKLNQMKVEWLHIIGEDVNLKVKLGANRVWMGGSGRNIPSFELFASPDWRGTEGWIKFNQPLYRYGNVIENAHFEFENGQVVKTAATRGKKVLDQMLKSTNANKIGEFSLTDRRMSRITHVMAETLFDENIGGPFGNTHIAVGMAYKDGFDGDPEKVTREEWEEMGFNDSPEHTDLVSTTDRTVTATLQDGTEVVIYHQGQFVV